MPRVASPAQGVLGHHMEGSWQLCGAALEEPGNKGEKYRLKQQGVQKSASLLLALVCVALTHVFGKLTTVSQGWWMFD